MKTQNITLALPRSLIKQAKIVAAKRETSVSALVAAFLQEAVCQDQALEVAMQRVVARVQRGYDLGSNGDLGVGRDELHER